MEYISSGFYKIGPNVSIIRMRDTSWDTLAEWKQSENNLYSTRALTYLRDALRTLGLRHVRQVFLLSRARNSSSELNPLIHK